MGGAAVAAIQRVNVGRYTQERLILILLTLRELRLFATWGQGILGEQGSLGEQGLVQIRQSHSTGGPRDLGVQ